MADNLVKNTSTTRKLLQLVLDHPIFWEFSRIVLDIFFGNYSLRYKVFRKYNLLGNNTSVLDIGCGIGQFANVTKGEYLGLDLSEKYINYARKRNRRSRAVFQCMNVTDLNPESRFDLALMNDVLHHLSDRECVDLLNTCSRYVNKYVISFDPITEQRNQVGRWFVENDRGDYVRPSDKLHHIYEQSKLEIVHSLLLNAGPIYGRCIIASISPKIEIAEKGLSRWS